MFCDWKTRSPAANAKAEISSRVKKLHHQHQIWYTRCGDQQKYHHYTNCCRLWVPEYQEHIPISSLTNVAPEQLIAIKGYLCHLSGTKKIIIQGFQVKKQEGYIANPSGYIKIIFWGNHTDKVKQGSTYFFNKVRVKVSQDQKYLNTPSRNQSAPLNMLNLSQKNWPCWKKFSPRKK